MATVTLHCKLISTQNFKCLSFPDKVFAQQVIVYFIITQSLQRELKLPYLRITGDKDKVN